MRNVRTVLLAHRPSQEGSYRLAEATVHTVQNAQLVGIGDGGGGMIVRYL